MKGHRNIGGLTATEGGGSGVFVMVKGARCGFLPGFSSYVPS
jgi:hypothetical protein